MRRRRSSSAAGEFALGLERLIQACNEAYGHGASGNRIFGSDFSIDLVIHPGAGAYICGEETALLESLEGKRGFPRIKPPYFPAAIGLYGEPTVVNNIETVSNLPWIVEQRGRGLRRPRRRPLDRARGSSPCPVGSTAPAGTSSRWRRRPFAT